MSYTEKLLLKADEVIPRVTLEDFENDSNSKVMIDVRQYEELQASGTVQGSLHIPKGVIEFRLNSNDDISKKYQDIINNETERLNKIYTKKLTPKTKPKLDIINIHTALE